MGRFNKKTLDGNVFELKSFACDTFKLIYTADLYINGKFVANVSYDGLELTMENKIPRLDTIIREIDKNLEDKKLKWYVNGVGHQFSVKSVIGFIARRIMANTYNITSVNIAEVMARKTAERKLDESERQKDMLESQVLNLSRKLRAYQIYTHIK